MKNKFSDFPIINDVKNNYIKLRRQGNRRDQAVERILDEYKQELLDMDDSPQVWLGLAYGLGAKKELTEELLLKAKDACDSIQLLHPELAKSLHTELQCICQVDLIGSEAKYNVKHPFDPKWEIGDTFAYHLLGDYPQKYGLNNHFVLLRKIDTIIDDIDNLKHQFYLTLCSPDAIPKTSAEIEQLGYLPLCSTERGFEYRAVLQVQNQRKLNQYTFFKVGCFPDVAPPKKEVLPDAPLHGWPLYDLIYKPNHSNNLERYTCWNYKKYGIIF